jgi:broad specificity phosphatase PhoE
MVQNMAIFLIRHAETTLNAQHIVQRPDTPLSDRGFRQAECLGQRLAGLGVGRILASDYARARMTAERIADAAGVAIELDETLRERNFGDLRGRSYSELGDIFAEDFVPPAGESWGAFFERADRSWEIVRETANQTAGNLAVVTHGLVCYSFALRSLSLPMPAVLLPNFFANTSLTIVEARPPFRVELLGCSAHLDAGPIEDDRSRAKRAQDSVC